MNGRLSTESVTTPYQPQKPCMHGSQAQVTDNDIDEHNKYRIAQNFGGRKHWRIWRLGANLPKFYPSKFSITLVFYRCSAQSANVFSAKYILGSNLPKFSTARVLCYTVTPVLLLNGTYLRMIHSQNWHPHLKWPEGRHYGSLQVLVGPCDQQVAERGGH